MFDLVLLSTKINVSLIYRYKSKAIYIYFLVPTLAITYTLEIFHKGHDNNAI